MLKVSKYTTGVIQTNVYFCLDTETGRCIIIDPAANAARITEIVEKQLKAKPEAILLTHGHFDHMMAAAETAAHFSVKIHASETERALLGNPVWNLSENFGTSVTVTDFVPLKDGEHLELLGRDWQVIATPGHTAGSVCYYTADTGDRAGTEAGVGDAAPILFSGDTLFKESFGRSDFPTGSEKQLMESITEKLLPLPEDTAVYPGHEGTTTIGNERKFNPAAYLSKLGRDNV